MPRIRDFRGVTAKSFDGRGNYALGLKEQIIFPEINYDCIDAVRGMDVIVTTTARTDDEARELLRLLGFTFPIEAPAKEAACITFAGISGRTGTRKEELSHAATELGEQ